MCSRAARGTCTSLRTACRSVGTPRVPSSCARATSPAFAPAAASRSGRGTSRAPSRSPWTASSGGNPDDDQPFPNQTAVSWLGPPVNKWMMLYGGGGSTVGRRCVGSDRWVRRPDRSACGSPITRGVPWSPPAAHLDPGSPAVVGDPFGPGGFIFHPACEDRPPAMCARSDPYRPLDFCRSRLSTRGRAHRHRNPLRAEHHRRVHAVRRSGWPRRVLERLDLEPLPGRVAPDDRPAEPRRAAGSLSGHRPSARRRRCATLPLVCARRLTPGAALSSPRAHGRQP